MIWKEASWPNCKVLPWHSPGVPVVNHKKPRHGRFPDRDFNPGPSEYAAGVLTTEDCLFSSKSECCAGLHIANYSRPLNHCMPYKFRCLVSLIAMCVILSSVRTSLSDDKWYVANLPEYSYKLRLTLCKVVVQNPHGQMAAQKGGGFTLLTAQYSNGVGNISKANRASVSLLPGWFLRGLESLQTQAAVNVWTCVMLLSRNM
jgi:hypothetical protein